MAPTTSQHRLIANKTMHVPRRLPTGRRDQGFILVAVLWLALLLAMFASSLTASTNLHLQTTRNSVERTRAELLALSGIRLALLDQLAATDGTAPLRFTVGAEPATCRMPEGDLLRLTLTNEAGKIDLNAASDELLTALLVGTGVDRDQALRIVDRIADWRDGDDIKRANGAEAAEYRAAGRNFGPKNAAFDSVLELTNVLDIDSTLVARLRPHLTVFSGTTGIDPRHASPQLLQLLATGAVDDIGKSDRAALARQLPPRFITPAAATKALTVRAEVMTPGGTRFVNDAIVTREERVATQDRRSAPTTPLADNIGRARPGRNGASGRGTMVQGFRLWQLEPGGDVAAALLQQAADIALPPC